MAGQRRMSILWRHQPDRRGCLGRGAGRRPVTWPPV